MIHGGFPHIRCDLSVCLNPLGPPPEVEEWWKNPAQVWLRYPEAHAEQAREVLASRLSLSCAELLLGNGCGELFALALRALNISEVALVRPCYGGYRESACLAGCSVRTLDLPCDLWGADHSGSSYPQQMLPLLFSALGTDFRGALFLGNPNNPDGRLLQWESVEQIAASIPNGFLFLDQSYMDFIELPGEQLGWRAPERLPANVLVFQSFTKFFCLAGVRLACVYGNQQLLALLRCLQLPWTVNGPAQAMARLLYENQEWLNSVRPFWKRIRQTAQQEWSLRGVALCQHEVPWLFGRLPPHLSGEQFLNDCLQQGLAVRVFQKEPEQLERYVRIGLPMRERT